MGEKDPEQMENIQLSVDPPIPTSENIPEGKEQLPTPQPNDLGRKLMGVFAASTALAIFLWFMAGAGFPWFIYIPYGVSVINSIIYAVKTKNSFFANWTIYASTNVMLFITFLAGGGGYPWFFIPLSAMAILPVSQYIWKHYDKPLRYLYIHAAIYLLINTMIFFIWVTDSLYNPYPWFIYPWCGWGVLLLIHYNSVIMHDKSRLFVFVCADLGIMLMITFRFAIGPLFMVLLLLGFIAVVLYYLFLKKGYGAHCWCTRRRADTAQPQGDSVEAPAQHAQPPPPPPTGFSFGIPQIHMQLHPPYQHMPTLPPGSAYFSTSQAQFPYQGAPSYYAYFPSNGGLYPTIATIPAQGNPSVPVPVPSSSVPVPGDAVLSTHHSDDAHHHSQPDDAKPTEEEDTHLLRNSTSRSYSPTNSQ